MFARALILFLVAIFAFILLIAGIHYVTRPASAAEEVDVAIVFVVDVSGSMADSEIATMREAHATALVSPDVLDAIRDGERGRIAAAYVEFGTFAQTIVGWTIIDGQAAAQRFADSITASSTSRNSSLTASTQVGDALLHADKLLGEAPPSDRIVVDIAGDGTNGGGSDPELGRAAILSRGGVINAMPVLMLAPDFNLVPWYKAKVAGGPGHFVMPIAGIDKMPMALRSKLVQELY